MWLSLWILFVYFLTLPSLLHSSILFNCFYTCFYLIIFFFIALSKFYQCHLTWFVHSTLVYFSRRWEVRNSRMRGKSVATPLAFLCLGARQADKEAAQVAMRLFHLWRNFFSFVDSSYYLFITEVLSWLTAKGPHPTNGRSSIQRSTALVLRALA